MATITSKSTDMYRTSSTSSILHHPLKNLKRANPLGKEGLTAYRLCKIALRGTDVPSAILAKMKHIVKRSGRSARSVDQRSTGRGG